jgi:hypothetical protein
VRFQSRRVNHDPLRLRSLAGKAREDAMEDAEPAPADEAVVERPVRTVSLGASFHCEPSRMT